MEAIILLIMCISQMITVHFSRLLIGLLCISVAAYSYFTTNEAPELISIILGLYGIFSIGFGIYMLNKKEKN